MWRDLLAQKALRGWLGPLGSRETQAPLETLARGVPLAEQGSPDQMGPLALPAPPSCSHSGLAAVGVTRALWWQRRRLRPGRFCSRHGLHSVDPQAQWGTRAVLDPWGTPGALA